MAETTSVECGLCHKRFRVRQDQLNRKVKCPHCKTIITVHASVSVDPALAEIGRAVTAPTAPGHRAVSPEQKVMSPGPVVGVKSKNAALIWISVLGVALVVGIILAIMAVGRGGCQGPQAGHKDEKIFAKGNSPTSSGSPTKAGGLFGQGAGGVTPSTTAAGGGGPVMTKPEAGVAGTEEDTSPAVSAKVARIFTVGTSQSYVVGRVVVNGGQAPVLRVTVPILDRKSNRELAKVSTVLLNVPGGKAIPLIIPWNSGDEDVDAVAGKEIKYEINPPDIQPGFPPIEVLNNNPNGDLVPEDPTFPSPMARADANDISSSGTITAFLKNTGQMEVRNVEMMALLLDEKHAIVGVARGYASRATRTAGPQSLKPRASELMTITWTGCAGSKVATVDVWAQAAIR
jgi:predicted Zn finger-like uncharacterized protein